MANTRDNQKCFNCKHWQGYPDELIDPPVNNGECRRMPRGGNATDNPTVWNVWWPFIGNGDDFWCSCWEINTKTPVVQNGTPRATSWPSDWLNFHANPWNARAAFNQSCWNCDHYQYDVAAPSAPGENTGECRKFPVPAVIDLVVGLTTDTLQPSKLSYAGSSYCCGRWEIKQGTVPTDPGPAPQ